MAKTKRRRGRPTGYKLSDESKRKISNTKTGVKHDEKTKQKISNTLKTYFNSHIQPTLKPEGSRKISGGYAFIKVGREWVSEHRNIVEEFIGRKLGSEEIVHHKDFNKINNHIYNLQLVTLPEHKIIHNRKRWLITDPDGFEEIVFNLSEFCDKNDLSYRSMRNVANGKAKKGLHRGYGCEKLVV
jgi:hypothetical protein